MAILASHAFLPTSGLAAASPPAFPSSPPPPSLNCNGSALSITTPHFPPAAAAPSHHVLRRSPPDRPGSLPTHTATATSTSNPRSRAASASLSRSFPVNVQHASFNLVRRLTQQNAFIRDAWEAERNYLEANRRRAEEVYLEERFIMDELRDDWDEERAVMLEEIRSLRRRVDRLESENRTLKAVAAQSAQAHGVVARTPHATPSPSVSSADANNRGDSKNNAGNNHAPRLSSSAAYAAAIPPGLRGAARRPHFHDPGGARASPSTQPESSPFIPLDPRMQSRNATTWDFLARVTSDDGKPLRVVDVQEIDPNLEGILLKSAAVERATFSGSEATSTPVTSPQAQVAPQDEWLSAVTTKQTSRDQTLRALSVDESRRRTMHAGHTPNHSLSLFPTLQAENSNAESRMTDSPTFTAAQSRDLQAEKWFPEEPAEQTALSQTSETSRCKRQEAEKGPDQYVCDDEHPVNGEAAENLERVNDVQLKAPLMIRNIPAQDELFWRTLNSKLEPISQGQGSLPTAVRRSDDDERDLAAGPSVQRTDSYVDDDALPDDGPSSHASDGTVAANDAESGVEVRIPLKLKNTTNFGAPFGVA